MHLDELRILPGATPGCVVDGRFGLEAPQAVGGDPVFPADARISLFMRGTIGAWLNLSELKEEQPGIYARANQELLLSLQLPASVDLERLLVDMTKPSAAQGARRVEGARLSGYGVHGRILGSIPSLEIEAHVLEAGLGVRFSGEVDAMTKVAGLLQPPVLIPALVGSRIHADIVIPWTYLIVQRSQLASRGNKFHAPWKHGDPLFSFGGPGLPGVAFDRSSGYPIFPGPFTVDRGKASSCVMASDIDEMLVLDTCGTPWRLPDGFAAQNTYTLGPRLTLFGMGHGMWTRILGGERAGSLELKGDCVGFLTEVWILGAVAGRHAISAYRIDLALGETELVLKIRGEVGGLLRYDSPPAPPTLGPHFEVTVRIQVAFLVARGIDLVSWGASEKRLLKGESFH